MAAELKCYYDITCKKEILPDSYGKHNVNFYHTSDIAHLGESTIYVKNVGTNNAYSVAVNVTLPNAEVDINKTTIEPNEIAVISIAKDVAFNTNQRIDIEFELNYDNV
jgi:hypothetical protein